MRFLKISVILLLICSSCKELNEDYPPVNWTIFFFESENIPSRPVSAILYEKQNSIWLGCLHNEGILHHDGYGWKIFNKGNTGIEFDSITGFLRDGNGLLWISWKSGLATYDGTEWDMVPELSGKCITSLALEGIGTVWAAIYGDGDSGGLARFTNNSWSFFTAKTGFPSSRITSVTLDDRQNIWAGTSDKGIIKFKSGSWKITDHSTISTLSDQINAITTDSQGTVWAVTAASQLVCLNRDEPFLMNTGVPSAIRTIVAHEGILWMGTEGNGLVTFDGHHWKSYTQANSRLPGDAIIAAAPGPSGNVLLSYPSGEVIQLEYE